ncbi:MAG: magnesium transporter, partial [Bacteroidota bacterium]|nr:magnesium transporter [Bacteroidota bacterium]
MPFDLTKQFIAEIRLSIDKRDNNAARELLNSLHAVDIAEIYDELNIEEAKYLYLLLDSDKAADVIAELDEDDKEKFLNAIPGDVIAKQFIDKMDSDDAADVIGVLDEEKQEEILAHIKDIEQAGHIADLLAYDEDSAGGLMAKELIKVNENWTLNTCLIEMRKQVDKIDEVYY